KGDNYIQESVRTGETVERWTQMITVTGAKGLVANPSFSPQSVLEALAGGFKRACPETFSLAGLGVFKVSGYDAFAGWISCGDVQTGTDRHSESAAIVAIKGASDYYTVQWAERAAPVNQPIVLDKEKWTDRLKQLSPIKVC